MLIMLVTTSLFADKVIIESQKMYPWGSEICEGEGCTYEVEVPKGLLRNKSYGFDVVTTHTSFTRGIIFFNCIDGTSQSFEIPDQLWPNYSSSKFPEFCRGATESISLEIGLMGGAVDNFESTQGELLFWVEYN